MTTASSLLNSRIRAWWRSLDQPDPWSAELEAGIHADDAVPVCHRCFTPCDLPVWFCPACGASTGPYNNILPFVRLFAVGEVLRSGINPQSHPRPRFTFLVVPGYILVGLLSGGPLGLIFVVRYIWKRLFTHTQKSNHL